MLEDAMGHFTPLPSHTPRLPAAPDLGDRVWKWFIVGVGLAPILYPLGPLLILVNLFPAVSPGEMLRLRIFWSLAFGGYALALVALHRRWPKAVSLVFGLMPALSCIGLILFGADQ